MSSPYLPRRHTQLSPLCPPDASDSRSLERTQFEAMVQASRDRSTILSVKKPLALRKEIAVKAQKVLQLERRVHFLNKLCEPPSPSATECPVTPPDSPTIFHFTLPSPGLQSPWEHFEYVHDHPERYKNVRRVEKVDFRLPYNSKKRVISDDHRHSFSPVNNCVSILPSLDQISQRLIKGPMPCGARGLPSPERRQRAKTRLPSFLRSRVSSPLPGATPSGNDQHPRRPFPELPRLALRPPTPPENHVIRVPLPQYTAFPELTPSPVDKTFVEAQITTSLCPLRSTSLLPVFIEPPQFGAEQSTMLSEVTTTTLTERAQVTKKMFNKLSRRTSGIPNAAACGIRARDDISLTFPSGVGVEDKQRRRSSAPAEVPTAQSVHHPVLEKPGGF